MSLTTRVRITEPVDPREVWAQVLELINPPADYKWSHVPTGGNEIAWLNPLIYAEPGQGADIWAYLAYGPEGSPLRADDECDPPAAYVEVSLISNWSSEDLHDEIVVALSKLWSTYWCDDCQEWMAA